MGRRLSLAECLTNERHLFHGTLPEAALAICKHNFDPRVSGKHTTAYGQGSYFARRFNYSHGLHCLMPPPDSAVCSWLRCWSEGTRRADQHSVTHHPLIPATQPVTYLTRVWTVLPSPDPHIFVVFDGDQCYPYFLIRYRLLDNTLVV